MTVEEKSASSVAVPLRAYTENAEMGLLKWNLELESDLIDEVGARENLWNPNHPHYHKRVMKRLGFSEISINMLKKWPPFESLLTPGELKYIEFLYFS